MRRVKIIQRLSLCKKTKIQRDNILGLGLKKIGDVSILDYTPEVAGMLRKVLHMVSVEYFNL